MKNRKLWVFAAVMLLAVCLMGMIWIGSQEGAVAGRKTITVTVVHGDGSQKEFTYDTDAEYLGEIILAEGLAGGETGDFGLMIHTVDGETASWEQNRSYWSIYVGDDYATTGADGIILNDGGEYSLVYTIG